MDRITLLGLAQGQPESAEPFAHLEATWEMNIEGLHLTISHENSLKKE